jgi:1-acyl-sn-glycerol-3-phosphate acyltransferase
MKILSNIRALYVLIEFIFTVGIAIILMYIFNKHHRYVRKIWAKLQVKLVGFKIDVTGEADPDAKIILINHQSLLDIVIIEAIHPGDPAWVAKKEIANIPFFGRILDAPKMITIDREDKRSLVKLLKEAKDRLTNGRVIAMFPEGTRAKTDKLLKFKPGAKLIAEKLNLSVQPIILTNTRNILDSQNFTVNRGAVKVIFMDTINPKENDNWYEDLRENMQKTLISAKEK